MVATEHLQGRATHEAGTNAARRHGRGPCCTSGWALGQSLDLTRAVRDVVDGVNADPAQLQHHAAVRRGRPCTVEGWPTKGLVGNLLSLDGDTQAPSRAERHQ